MLRAKRSRLSGYDAAGYDAAGYDAAGYAGRLRHIQRRGGTSSKPAFA